MFNALLQPASEDGEPNFGRVDS